MKEYALEMTTTEIKPITVKTLDLQEGETVTGATATHIPPAGDPLDIAATFESPYINMIFGPFEELGQHHVKARAEGSMGSKPEVLYTILVKI